LKLYDDAEIVFVNKAFESFFGYPYKKLVGKDGMFLVSEEYKNLAKEISTSTDELVFVLEIVKKDGSKSTIEIHSHPIPYKDKICRLNAIKEID